MLKKVISMFLFMSIFIYANNDKILQSKPDIFTYLNLHKIDINRSVFDIKIVKDIFKLSILIRGDSAVCMGDIEFKNRISNFIKIIKTASHTPNVYAKTLPASDLQENIKDKQQAYLRYWGYQCYFNFINYKQFIDLYAKSQSFLVEYYQKKGFSILESAYYATAVLGEFLNYAVGDYPNLQNLNLDISKEQKFISEKSIDEDNLPWLYSKTFTPLELTQILNTALLHDKDINFLNLIIKRGASLEAGDETPLFFALHNIKNTKFLLNFKVNVNHKNSFGKSAIFYAVEFKDIDLIKLLIENGADVNDSYVDKNTKDALINLGKDIPFYINMCGLEHTKRTVLMHASFHSHPSVLKILIESGADLKATDELGFNALDYARLGQNTKNINFLKNIGIKYNFFKEEF